MTLKDQPYHEPFQIGANIYAKSGTSVDINQNPPNPIGVGPTFYRCFHVDPKTMKKKATFYWIGVDVEVEQVVPLQPNIIEQ